MVPPNLCLFGRHAQDVPEDDFLGLSIIFPQAVFRIRETQKTDDALSIITRPSAARLTVAHVYRGKEQSQLS